MDPASRRLSGRLGLTRRTLDPALRDLAVGTSGVEFFPGWTAKRVVADPGRVTGIALRFAHNGPSIGPSARPVDVTAMRSSVNQDDVSVFQNFVDHAEVSSAG